MVLFHTVRVYRTIARGKMAKASVVASYAQHLKAKQQSPTLCTISGEVSLPLCAESKCKMYMGLRMMDMFGHINNSRYIEAMEFARWYQMASSGLLERVNRAQLVPIVASVDVQYVREIKPMKTVVMRTQIGTPSGRNMVFYQQIESLKGDVVHATGIVRFAWLNAKGNKNQDGSAPRGGPVGIEEALLRMGYAQSEIDSYVSGEIFNNVDATQFYGSPVSGYDKKLSSLIYGGCDSNDPKNAALVELRDNLSLCKTFPQDKMEAVNEADLSWRNLLRKEAKERKELFNKSKQQQ